MTPTKQKKAKKKGTGRPSPAEIEKLRKERQARRDERARLLEADIDPDDPKKRPLFNKRDLLEIPHEHDTKAGTTLRIMTYNLLAQTLIRRKMFPDNGEILKWANRQTPLLHEVKRYDSDIMCFQEMDYTNFVHFWKDKLKEIGFSGHFNRREGKSHGVAIFFRESLFTLIEKSQYEYDTEESGDISPRTTTQNVGLLLALALKAFPKKAICVGTTHLFWHPFGTYERTRQTYVLLSKCKQFENRVRSLHPEIDTTWKFFAGDFNSQPFDSPYLSITSKPVHYDNRCKKVISCSTSFQFSSKRDGGDGEDEEGGNVEKFGENQPKSPVPNTFTATKEQIALVQKMQDLHNSLPMRAISLYSVAYNKVDPSNSGIDNDRKEPFFSNWAYTWRGLLDYIFVVRDWDKNMDCREIDDLETFEKQNGLVLRKLLKIPHPDEMGKGLPRQYQYPSDHLCMIAELELST